MSRSWKEANKATSETGSVWDAPPQLVPLSPHVALTDDNSDRRELSYHFYNLLCTSSLQVLILLLSQCARIYQDATHDQTNNLIT